MSNHHLFLYDAAAVEASIQHWVDTQYFQGTAEYWGYADPTQLCLRVEVGIGNLISSPGLRIGYLLAVAPGNVQDAFATQAAIVQDFLQQGKLPKKPVFARGDWKVVHYHALVQIGLLYCLMRLQATGAQAEFVNFLEHGQPREVDACLWYLWLLQSADFHDISPVVQSSIRSVALRHDRQVKAIAGIAQAYQIPGLIPRLQHLAQTRPPPVSLSIHQAVIALESDPAKRQEICRQVMQTLDNSERLLFFRMIACEGIIDVQTKRLVMNRIFQQMSDPELLVLLGDWRLDIQSLLLPEHAVRLRQLLAIVSEHEDEWMVEGLRKVAVLLSTIESVRDVALLFQRSDFEYVAGSLIGTLQPSEIESVIRALRPETRVLPYGLGKSSVILLWKECGESGQHYLRDHLELINYEGCVALLNLIRHTSSAAVAHCLVELNLCSTKIMNERLLGEAFKKGDDIDFMVKEMMAALDRGFTCDAESGQIPPDYQYLLRLFCKASHGKFTIDEVSVVPIDSENETDGYQIALRWNDQTITEFSVQYTGDWYDDQSVAAHLNEVAKRKKIRDRFCFVMGTGQSLSYFFGPPKKIDELLARTSTLHPPTIDGCEALRAQIKYFLDADSP